jgi:hypothetical protein
MAGKIIIEIIGEAADGGDVRLDALVDQLDSLRKALTYAEQHAAIGGKRRALYYRVVDLHHSYPTFEIEPVAVDPHEDRSGATILEFDARLRQIQAGKIAEDISVEELEAYGDIGPKAERHISRVNLRFDAPAILKAAEPFQMTNAFEQKVAELIGPEEVAWGTMTGFLDAINLHERNVFYLWPRVGPTRLHCTFDRTLRDDVKQAIDHYVQVAGRIHYRRRSHFAHRMTAVHSVERVDLSGGIKLSDVKGIAPLATGGMETREFVDTYDEDWS